MIEFPPQHARYVGGISRYVDESPDTKQVLGYTVHRTHHFIAADDVYECSTCMVRPYNEDARKPCPEDNGHGGPQ